jgi:hypothetical protein
MHYEYAINLSWDDEASVWMATSDDIYGLILEDESVDKLIYRVRLAVPELLAFEKQAVSDIFLDFSINRKERLVFSG